MTSRSTLSRRQFLSLAGASLSACGGGGGGSNNVAQGGAGSGGSTGGGGTYAPGTGGTGIYSWGRVSGFGSVYINQVKYGDSAAQISLDGLPGVAHDLRLGMTAVVTGRKDANGSTGVAERIESWSVAQGVVGNAQVVAGNPGNFEFELMGLTIECNAGTLFDGVVADVTSLPGSKVLVWGFQVDIAARRWRATRVAPALNSESVTTGLVSKSGTTLNGYQLTGKLDAVLLAGRLVRVVGNLASGGSQLAVLKTNFAEFAASGTDTGEAEIEGIASSAPAGGSFRLGSVQVDSSKAIISPANTSIAVNQRLEVHGVWRSGILVASTIQIAPSGNGTEVEIDSTITQFNSLADFVLRGQHCNAVGLLVIGNGTASDLKVGLRIHIHGKLAGNIVTVTELEIVK